MAELVNRNLIIFPFIIWSYDDTAITNQVLINPVIRNCLMPFNGVDNDPWESVNDSLMEKSLICNTRLNLHNSEFIYRNEDKLNQKCNFYWNYVFGQSGCRCLGNAKFHPVEGKLRKLWRKWENWFSENAHDSWWEALLRLAWQWNEKFFWAFSGSGWVLFSLCLSPVTLWLGA